MPHCKQCGAKYGLWSGRSDDLCKNCGTKADEDARQQAERKEAERKLRVLEDSKRDIDIILKAMTTEPPLAYSFISWNIQEKKSGGLLGVVVGGALGGIAGAMIGNCLAPGSCTYSGEIGILVVTNSQVLIGHFSGPLQSGDGRLVPDHLGLFRAQLDARTISRKTFNIRQTQVSRSFESDSVINLACGDDNLSFRKSDLYVNNTLYDLPSVSEIHNQIAQQGTLVTPVEFTFKLLQGENPISEDQFQEIENDGRYIEAIFNAILKHPERDALVQKFPCLDSTVRDEVETRVRNRGAAYHGAMVKLGVWLALTIAASIGIWVTRDFLCFLSVVGTFVTAIGSIVAFVNVRRSRWCQNVLDCLPVQVAEKNV